MTESMIGADLAGELTPELVSPLVAYLCHSTLEQSGLLISVGGGRFARVATGVCPGVSTEHPSADFAAESFEAIIGEEEMLFPANAMEEIALALQASN
jgi:hypothetical protein